MSTALITMVKNERDIIEPFLRHSAHHVDVIYVADHGSTDGTRERLDDLAQDLPLVISDLTDPGYWQSRFMSELAQKACADGHAWGVFADCDEIWYVSDDPNRRVADYLAGLVDVQVVAAQVFSHIPTAYDLPEPNPFKRIIWKKKEKSPLPKVSARLHPSIIVDAGNHYVRFTGRVHLSSPGFSIRHFSWRSREQFLRKIRTGEAAYAHTNLREDIGQHWRMFSEVSDEDVMRHFDNWFFSTRPKQDDTLVIDPAPLAE